MKKEKLFLFNKYVSQEMADIIETANTAYEARDKANDLIQSLKQQAKRESAEFEKELRELS